MEVMINGNKHELPKDVNTVLKLIKHLEMTNPVIIVELNEQILQKEEHESTSINDGDKLEFIQFVGGG